MSKFWTVTDCNTTHTNSRSTRFRTIEDAIREASMRIENGRAESIYILECIKVVKRAKIPFTVEDVHSQPVASSEEELE